MLSTVYEQVCKNIKEQLKNDIIYRRVRFNTRFWGRKNFRYESCYVIGIFVYNGVGEITRDCDFKVYNYDEKNDIAFSTEYWEDVFYTLMKVFKMLHEENIGYYEYKIYDKIHSPLILDSKYNINDKVYKIIDLLKSIIKIQGISKYSSVDLVIQTTIECLSNGELI